MQVSSALLAALSSMSSNPSPPLHLGSFVYGCERALPLLYVGADILATRWTTADQILIHYQKKDRVVALVVADDTAGRRVPFSFLADLHRKFTSTYGVTEIEDAPAFGMNGFEKEIEKLMVRPAVLRLLSPGLPDITSKQTQYEDNPPQDAIKAAQAELAATKNVMVKSIDAVLSRGERIEILVDRTDEMSHQARAFRKRATVLRCEKPLLFLLDRAELTLFRACRRKMWYRNAKTLFAVGFSALVRYFLSLRAEAMQRLTLALHSFSCTS